MKHYLIVVDMQKDFVDGALGTKEAAAMIPDVVKAIEDFDGSIFATLDTHDEDYLATREGRYLPVPHCIRGTEGHALDSRVAAALEAKGYTSLQKPSFGSTILPNLLRTQANGEPFDITVLGLCTEICVISNAMILKANFPEMDIRVLSSCCAGVTPQAHSKALDTMRSCQIDII